LRVVHLSKSNYRGGADRAAYRLHIGLKMIRVASKMIVDDKIGTDDDVYTLQGAFSRKLERIRYLLNNIPLKIYSQQGMTFYLGLIGRNIVTSNIIKQSDIINLHWVSRGFLSIFSILKFAKLNKPIVWTLHDMWAFTGGCHHSLNCTRYFDGCGKCPQLNSRSEIDITRIIWKIKEKVYKWLNLTIITPSKWLAETARKSPLLSRFNIIKISNGVNIRKFKPINKDKARTLLNLPKDKKIILFGAAYLSKWKGFNYLINSIKELIKAGNLKKDDTMLMIFGAPYHNLTKGSPIEIRYVGPLLSEDSLNLCYNASDVLVIPSLWENFPNVAIEALSCGVPVVGFRIGGIPEIVDHKVNGYVANYLDIKSLANGIKWVLDHDNIARLKKAAREKAVKMYTLEKQAKRYKQIYQLVLDHN